jgi:hypothetical protein
MSPTARRLRGLLAGAALTSLLLTGCDAGDLIDQDRSGADPSISEPSEPAATEGALSVGDTFDGAVSTTVETILRGEGDDSWLRAGVNFEWLSAAVRTCVSAGGSTTEVGWYQWAVTDADGAWYPADLDYDRERPTGQYPKLADLAPGECTEGRILIAVPRDADRAGVPQGSWLVGDIGVPAATDGE